MARATFLERKARNFIVEQIRDKGEITTDEATELIRPHFLFDPSLAKEQAIRRKATQLISSLRDENGVRTCFAAIDEGHTYVNVEKSTDSTRLFRIEAQLKGKFSGLNASLKKVRRRISEVVGQVSFDDVKADNNAAQDGKRG